MRLSISKGNQGFKEVNVQGLHDLKNFILDYNYSPGVFENGDRKNNKFIAADFVALDFDGELSMAEVKRRLSDYQYLLAPTRNHMKEKNGAVKPRFRAILPLEETIYDGKAFRQTMISLLKVFPEADQACKDPARMYYPSQSALNPKKNGKKWAKSEAIEVKTDTIELTQAVTTKLKYETLQLLLLGAKPGTANTALYKGAKDCQRAGYTQEEFISMVQNMIDNGGEWGSKHVNQIDKNTIKSAYTSEPDREEYVQEFPFNFVGIGDLIKRKIDMKWVVEGLLQESGLSILAGRPKSGKSTLTRQLAKSIIRGEEFLGRKVKHGKVLYCALEESEYLLQKQFKNLGITADDNDVFKIHIGDMDLLKAKEPLTEYIREFDPALVVIDTLSLFAKFTDSNSYDEVDKKMTMIRDIARQTSAHIVLIHHTNKTSDIMGSQGFLGSVDAALYFMEEGSQRYLKTAGRGLTGFKRARLDYNDELEIYSFGEEANNEF